MSISNKAEFIAQWLPGAYDHEADLQFGSNCVVVHGGSVVVRELDARSPGVSTAGTRWNVRLLLPSVYEA